MSDGVTSPLATQPIPGDSPAGQSARYDPDFEQMQAEILKLENPAGGEVKWNVVQELAEKILSGKSKDLLAAVYYAVARLQREGYPGLNMGLGVIQGMCQTFWEPMFPEIKRMKARESALEWLIDRVNRQLVNDGGSVDKAVTTACANTMNQLANFVNSKLETPNPLLDGFVRALNSAGQAAAAPAQGGGAPAAGGAAAAPSGPIGNRKQAFDKLKEVADFLRKTEPHSPVSYLVQRAVKWGSMTLEDVLSELVKNNDVRKQLFETLGVREEGQKSG